MAGSYKGTCYVFTGLWTAPLLSVLSSTISIYFPLSYADYIGLLSSLSPYPLSHLSSIVPDTIEWRLSYRLILVADLILYDTWFPKAVLLYTWTTSPHLSSLTCSESSASI